MTVRLELLGGFEAKDASGKALAFPTAKSLALLAYLVLNGGQPHFREKLATLLWGSSRDDHARGSLRQALSRIKRAWPASEPQCLMSDGARIAVDGMAVEVDVLMFQRLAAEGTPDALRRAAELYRGELLDGLLIDEADFDDWLRQERARLQELALGVLQRLLDHYATTGAIERGIAVATRLLALDPYQEAVQRTLMRFYLYQERRGAALAQYRQCRDLLKQELGSEPEPETLALYQQICEGAPEPGPSDDACDPRPSGDGKVVIVPSRRPTRRRRLTPGPSIAVLPFESLHEEGGDSYLGDGVAEDIITELTRFRELYVIARNSSFSYRLSRVPLQHIGRELGVHYLLQGSLRRQGERIRLTVQLIEADSSQQIWAERYDEAIDDLFAVQDEVVRRIVATLVDRIAAERLCQARRKPPETWQAYDHWLQGRAHLRRVDVSSLALARAAFEKAAETDPSYARAYAGLAMTYFRAWSCYNWNAWAMLGAQASEHARKAVELDENDHHAHGILSASYVFKRDFAHARLHIERALALNPHDAGTLANATVVWSYYGDGPEAVRTAEAAMQLDPHHPDWYAGLLGMACFVDRDYGAAVAAMSGAPEAICDTRAYLAAAHAFKGEAPEAERHAAEFLRFCGERMGGTAASDAERYMEWLRNANPYRREQDIAHFIEGLRKAGLPA